jgi:hypothetical protein
MSRTKLLSLVAFVCLLAPSLASADDFAPPPWPRSHPHAITAEWEFTTPPPNNPGPPDGPLTDLSNGGGTVPGGTHVDVFGPGIGWGGTSGGNWFFPAGGTGARGMRFWVDDVIDFEPFKHLRVQVTSTPGLGLSLDPMAGFNFTATGSTPGPVSVFSSPGTSPFGPVTHTLFTWDMFPNPPWESFTLHVTPGTGGEIRQVVVDTISTHLPEPGTFMVYGAIALCLGLVARKCPQLLKQALS